ncbi:aspartate/glutamate racemase family protein [Oxalobacteraceae bacterium OM1]|nr:aspartate/glutamate racemase family protein [Oxalobacteraceae bacterium OM1]
MSSTIDGAKIGILCWETGHVPRGLMQLETLVGNSTNPASYAYPIRLKPVKGANVHTILEHPDRAVLQTMIEDARAMVADGVKGVTTSCGFNAIFQRELAAAISVPVFASSLLQVPLVRHIHGPTSEICIITAKAGALRPEHFLSVGIEHQAGLIVCGLEECAAWNRIFTEPEMDVDLDEIEREVVGTALRALERHPNIRAFVLECTDLPPFSESIRQKTGLPVFDFISMVDYLHSVI